MDIPTWSGRRDYGRSSDILRMLKSHPPSAIFSAMKLSKWTCTLLALSASAAAIFAAGTDPADKGTDPAGMGTDPARPVLYVGIKPVAWLANELSCGRVEVRVLLPDGADPHTFEPPMRQITQLSASQGYASIGLPFERRLETGSVPIFELKNTESVPTGSADDPDESGSVPNHGTEGGHGPDHDPHVWLTPDGMAGLARGMLAAMDGIDAGGAEKRRAAFSDLEKRLAAMDGQFKTMFAPHEGKTIVAHHPSWARFADRYGFRLDAIEEEGREPSTRRLVQIVENARRQGVKTVFAEPQFSRRTAEALARQLGGRVVTVDPLSGDWESNIMETARLFAEALEEEKAE